MSPIDVLLTALVGFGVVISVAGLVSVVIARRSMTELEKRARAHNRNRGDMPRMCGECGAYLTRYHSGRDYEWWDCDVCEEVDARRKEVVAEVVAEHNGRILAALLGTSPEPASPEKRSS